MNTRSQNNVPNVAKYVHSNNGKYFVGVDFKKLSVTQFKTLIDNRSGTIVRVFDKIWSVNIHCTHFTFLVM